MKLSDLTFKPRHEKIMLAVNGILRQIDAPISTSELVKRVTAFLHAEEGTSYVAKELQKALANAGGHPLRRATGEVFRKYGREMPRYEWLPSHKQGRPVPETVTPEPEPPIDPERAWRRKRQRAIEAGEPDPGPYVAPDADIDAWTVLPDSPADPGEDPDFLEED